MESATESIPPMDLLKVTGKGEMAG